MTELAWTHPVNVAELPEHGAEFRISPDEAARKELAKFAGVLGVPQLSAIFQVRPTPDGGALVEGTLEGVVTQECVVTLDPFDNRIFEEISLRFVPEGAAASASETEEDDIESDPPDELINGAVDLGMVATEFLALGIDPYPRKPGVVFEAPAAGEKPSAFAALERLKRGKDE